MISLVQFFLSSVILPCKHVFCFQDVTEEKKPGKGEKKKTGKGEKKKTGKGGKTAETQSYVKPLTVLEVSDKHQEEYSENNLKEEKKKKKKNVGKR